MRGVTIKNFLVPSFLVSYFLFYFLPLTPNRKEKINQHKENVGLDPIDCSLNYSNSFPPDKEVSFRPDILNSDNAELRSPQIELLYQFFRQMAETSNANIIPDADYLLATDNKNDTSIVWVGPAKQLLDTTKLKLTY